MFYEVFGLKNNVGTFSGRCVHYTPKHGSWLNQAEIAISLFSRQCLGKRRIGDRVSLRKETRALESSYESRSSYHRMETYSQESPTEVWLQNHAVTLLAH
jgi:hypothetical protein